MHLSSLVDRPELVAIGPEQIFQVGQDFLLRWVLLTVLHVCLVLAFFLHVLNVENLIMGLHCRCDRLLLLALVQVILEILQTQLVLVQVKTLLVEVQVQYRVLQLQTRLAIHFSFEIELYILLENRNNM